MQNDKTASAMFAVHVRPFEIPGRDETVKYRRAITEELVFYDHKGI